MKQRVCVFAIGKTGSGKTYFLRGLVQRCPRLLVVDVTGDYAELPNVTNCRRLADVAARFRAAGPAGGCRIRLEADLDRAAIRALLQDGGAEELPAGVAKLGPGAAAIAFAAGDVVLVLDELSLFCKAGYVPRPIGLVMTVGRHRSVSLLAGTQRPALVSRTVTAMADYTAFFHLEDPRDIQWASNQLGLERARSLLRLKVGQHVGAGDQKAIAFLQR